MTDICSSAGKKIDPSKLVNIPRLIAAYYTEKPDPDLPAENVSFGTSGHRGSAFKRTFNEEHILATSQAICEYRKANGINGPLFLGIDTHALSEPAFISCLQVLAANQVEVRIDSEDGYVSTPAISLAILEFNKANPNLKADGIVITPSHNPPQDGGFKYNPPHGGPADTDVTNWVQDRANQILKDGLADLKTISIQAAKAQSTTSRFDYNKLYVEHLSSILELEKIKASGLKAAVDPLGGAGLACWQRLIEEYSLPIKVVNDRIDPTFSFMYADWDGKVRMDCSSPYAMAGLLKLKDQYDIAFANDTDHDRHGIVTSNGLMNPNHYLAVAINYLFSTRENWSKEAAIGKTLVSSSMINKVAQKLGRKLIEVPVGFKWFVSGLKDGSVGFGGEESAGASFLRKDGTVWTTDKDGIILALLSAEILATSGKDPSKHYEALVEEFGRPSYARIDAPASVEEKKKLKALSAEQVKATELAGDKITAKLTEAPGNNAPIGGLKVETENGWFAARPSGTEDVYKIYAESFKGDSHLKEIQEEAKKLVSEVLSTPLAVS